MRQIWITKAGPPEVLEVKEAPDPEPETGAVRIRVEATGVNFADIMGRLGIYPDLPPMPVVPGYEVSGRIDAVGAGVEGTWAGRDVLAVTRFGGYADTVCVPTNQVFTRPTNMSALEAAAIPVNYFTAWQLLVVMGSLKAGETVLSIPRVVASGSPRPRSPSISAPASLAPLRPPSTPNCERWGWIDLIDYRTEDFEARTREITNGRGVELILDAVGGEFWKKGYRVLAPTGRLGMFGLSAAATGKNRNMFSMLASGREYAVASVQPAVADEREQRRVRRQSRSFVGRNRSPARMGRSDYWNCGRKAPSSRRSRALSRFDEAAQAHHFIQDRSNIGKVLLVP